MVIPIRPYRAPEEIKSDFELRRRKFTSGSSNNPTLSMPIQYNPTLSPPIVDPNAAFNLQHNIQQHQQAPLPTYRVNSPGINIAPTVNINVQNIIKSFEDPFGEDDVHNTDLPYIYDGALKMMHDFGYAMLRDDRHDIGFFRYTARRGYRAHPSRLHHWYIGAGLMVMAQMGGIISKAREFMEAGSELGDLNEMIGIEELESPSQSQQLPPLPVYGNQVQTISQPSLPQPRPSQLSQTKLPQLPDLERQVIEYTPAKPSPRIQVPNVPKL